MVPLATVHSVPGQVSVLPVVPISDEADADEDGIEGTGKVEEHDSHSARSLFRVDDNVIYPNTRL